MPRQQEVHRHLATTFNTHPYVAAAIVGGILNHEERIARGEEPLRKHSAEHFKASLMGPLAALGDGFFWLSLRHLRSARSALRSFRWLGAWSAVAVFLVLYNAVHFYARARFFSLGYRFGDGLVSKLAAANIPRWGERLRAVAAASSGAVAAYLAVLFSSRTGLPMMLSTFGAVALAIVAYVISDVKSARWLTLYGSALLAIVAGALQ